MKKFLLKNNYGNVLLIIVISIITLLLSSTISLILLGIGIIGLDHVYDRYINDNVYDTAVSIWTLIMIVVFILLTIVIWVELLCYTDNKYNQEYEK